MTDEATGLQLLLEEGCFVLCNNIILDTELLGDTKYVSHLIRDYTSKIQTFLDKRTSLSMAGLSSITSVE